MMMMERMWAEYLLEDMIYRLFIKLMYNFLEHQQQLRQNTQNSLFPILQWMGLYTSLSIVHII